MASSLSEEEFQRLQLQLIDLRGQNYQLTDRCRLVEAELVALKAKFEAADKDLQRANKALSKNKKAKDWDLLLQENESLQQKLLSQEDDFRLQNSTLVQELSTLVARNEELEALVQKASGQAAATVCRGELAAPSSELEAQLRHLQAANAVLQRHLDELQQAAGAAAAAGESHLSYDVMDACDGDINRVRGDNQEKGAQADSKSYMEFKVQLETEQEEKRLLKVRLADLEKSSKCDIAALQSRLDEVSEKLRKKQEAFSQFQTDNEASLAEARKKIEYLEEARQRDARNHRGAVEKLQEDLSACRKDAEAFKATSLQYIAKLEQTVKSLETQVSEGTAASAEQRKLELEATKADNESIRSQLATAAERVESLQQLLADQEQKTSALEARLKETESRLESQVAATQDAVKLAEKRKNLLDELAMKAVEDDDRLKKKLKEAEANRQQELKALAESHQVELDSLGHSLDEARRELEEYGRCKQEVASLVQQNQSLEQAKDWLQRRLKDAEEALKQAETSHAELLTETVRSHETATQLLEAQRQLEIEDLRVLHQASVDENSDLQAEVQKLQQQVKDAVDEMRLHEKKGASLLKDLKKQVGLERSRAERLEQKLQELLASDTKASSRALSDELSFRAASPDASNRDETSSLSSWASHATPIIARDVISALHEQAPSSSSPQTPSLTGDLRRPGFDGSLIEELMRDKRILEEKVSMLEQSSAAMAEDLLQKQALIEHYIGEGKEYVTARPSEEKLTLKRVVDFVKDRGDETLKEKYRKAQRLLEETLTKNMHLQKDLEVLSQEITKLKSKE